MCNWRKLITEAFVSGDEWKDIEYLFPENLDLDKSFDSGYGGTEGIPFTLWTKENVYFPICYDGAEWVGSAPRNPKKIALEHQGGG